MLKSPERKTWVIVYLDLETMQKMALKRTWETEKLGQQPQKVEVAVPALQLRYHLYCEEGAASPCAGVLGVGGR